MHTINKRPLRAPFGLLAAALLAVGCGAADAPESAPVPKPESADAAIPNLLTSLRLADGTQVAFSKFVPDPGSERADAIRHWMIFDSHRPPSRPDKTFRQSREYASTRPVKPNKASLERTQREARWFAINQSGGSSILHHRHIRPVLAREWATEMDGIAATISASSSLFDYGGIRVQEYERQHTDGCDRLIWPR